MPGLLKNAHIIPALWRYLLMKQEIGGEETALELFNDKDLGGVTSEEVLIACHNHLIVHVSRLSPLVFVLFVIIVGSCGSPLL